MRKLLITALAAAAIASANAQMFTFTTSMSGDQVDPPNASPATGTGTFTLRYYPLTPDPNDNTLHYELFVQNLTLYLTATHIHADNGSLLLTLDGDSFGNAALYDRTVSVSDSIASAIVTGSYVDSHSVVYENGETRGDLVLVSTVPEPNSALLVGGLLGLGALVARRRNSRA